MPFSFSSAASFIPCSHSESTRRTCRDRDEARQYPLHRGGGSCPTGSIANTGIRIAAARSGKNRLGTGRSKKRPLVRAHCRCRAHIRFRVARNAAPCSRQYQSRLGNVRSAASNCTPVGSVRISILQAGLSARSPSRSGSRVKTSAINVRFIPCGFGWKRKLRRRVRRVPRMLARHSRICSRSK